MGLVCQPGLGAWDAVIRHLFLLLLKLLVLVLLMFIAVMVLLTLRTMIIVLIVVIAASIIILSINCDSLVHVADFRITMTFTIVIITTYFFSLYYKYDCVQS